MLVCHAACSPVTAGKLSEGLKEILALCQTSDLMLAENVETEGCYHGTRAPSIQDIVQVPVPETLHPWFLLTTKILCNFPLYLVAQH